MTSYPELVGSQQQAGRLPQGRPPVRSQRPHLEGPMSPEGPPSPQPAGSRLAAAQCSLPSSPGLTLSVCLRIVILHLGTTWGVWRINLVTPAKALFPSETPFTGPGGHEFGATVPPSHQCLRECIQVWNWWVISAVLRELPQQLPFLRTSPAGHRLPSVPLPGLHMRTAGLGRCCPPRGRETITHYGLALHVPGFLGV